MKRTVFRFVAVGQDSGSNSISSRMLFTTTLLASGLLARSVLAAEPDISNTGTQVAQAESSTPAASPSARSGPLQATPSIAGTSGGGVTTYTTPPPPSQNPYYLADDLKLRGWNVPLPGAANTIDQGLFGVRNALAEDGISWIGFASDTFQDNLLRHELPAGNQFGSHSRDLQQYNGQLPTYNNQISLLVNYDLRRYGIPDGQITIGGFAVGNNWNPSGPNGIGISEATYYQTLFDKKVEIKVGYVSNILEFLGTLVGGNLSSGIFGVNASIPVENGETLPTYASPGANVTLNFPDHIYNKFGVQRATSPAGPVVEREANPSSVRFTVPDAGVFLINELGYRVSAAPGRMQTWIRAAVNYTAGEYPDLTDQSTDRSKKGVNYGLYLLADRQILQTAPHAGPGSAIQGLYAGFSVMYGPPNVNYFSQYYEARLYGFGLIPGRPFDLLSLVWNRNVFSGYAVRGSRAADMLAHDAADTGTIAYSVHITHGVNLNVGLSFVDHPTTITYDRSTGSALNGLANLFVFF